MKYLTQQSESLLVFWRTSTSTGILPVQIQTIKAMGPQKCDGGLNKRPPVFWCGHHDTKPRVKREISWRWNKQFCSTHTSFSIQCLSWTLTDLSRRSILRQPREFSSWGFCQDKYLYHYSLYKKKKKSLFKTTLDNAFYSVNKYIHKQNIT